MADQSQSFEGHRALEADIKALAREIGRRRELPESVSLGEKEILKQALREMPPTASTPSQTTPPAQTAQRSPLPDYAQSASPEVKLEIEYLLDMAFHQGLGNALNEAKKSPAFVQDAFHDALAGRLYPELQRRGILK